MESSSSTTSPISFLQLPLSNTEPSMPRPNRFAQNKGTKHVERTSSQNERFIYGVKPQLDSPLFWLPAEIRLEIWQLALPKSDYRSIYDQPYDVATEINRLPNHVRDYNPRRFFHIWHPGTLSLLRTCKRINDEATALFWQTNCFDLVLDGVEPRVYIRYADPLMDGPVDSFVANPVEPRNVKPLAAVQRAFVALVPAWRIVVPNHHGLHIDRQTDPFHDWVMNTWSGDGPERAFARYCGSQSNPRKKYRQRVMIGFEKWLDLVGGRYAERRFWHFELKVLPYFDWKEQLLFPDPKLVKQIEEAVPEWLRVQRDANDPSKKKGESLEKEDKSLDGAVPGQDLVPFA